MSQSFNITLPPNTVPGATVALTLPNGNVMNFTVPKEVSANSTSAVDVPPPPPPAPSSLPPTGSQSPNWKNLKPTKSGAMLGDAIKVMNKSVNLLSAAAAPNDKGVVEEKQNSNSVNVSHFEPSESTLRIQKLQRKRAQRMREFKLSQSKRKHMLEKFAKERKDSYLFYEKQLEQREIEYKQRRIEVAKRAESDAELEFKKEEEKEEKKLKAKLSSVNTPTTKTLASNGV
eukprot:g3526.t1